jgi:vacuolar-type H+-ATPase subunit H
MDILHLVDRIEETVKKSPRLPFSAFRLVDERKIWSLVEQMRISIPEEVRRAQRISQERDRFLAEARERAEGLVRQAEDRADELTSEHAISRAAEARAVTIREKADREASGLRADADAYVFNSLCQLEEELRRALQVVENGLRKIQADQTTNPEEAST